MCQACFLFLLLAMFIPTTQSYAQKYQVDSVMFLQDTVLIDYLSQAGVMRTSWKAFTKSAMEDEFSAYNYGVVMQEDAVIIVRISGDRGDSIKLARVGADLYETISGSSFYQLELGVGAATLKTGKEYLLPHPDKENATYRQLVKQYGDTVRPQVVEVQLSKLTAEEQENALHIKKAFKVTDVSTQRDSLALAFAEEHADLTLKTAYHEWGRGTLESAYLDKSYIIEVDEPKITIRSHPDNKGRFSFSGKLQTVNDSTYRLQVLSSYYDLEINRAPEDPFEVLFIRYAETVRLRDAHKDKPGYAELKGRYGATVPYSTVVQEVKRIPLD